MKSEEKGWVIINIGHPTNSMEYIWPGSFRRTRKKAIQDFIAGTGGTWEWRKRNCNFRCVKATQTITTEIQEVIDKIKYI